MLSHVFCWRNCSTFDWMWMRRETLKSLLPWTSFELIKMDTPNQYQLNQKKSPVWTAEVHFVDFGSFLEFKFCFVGIQLQNTYCKSLWIKASAKCPKYKCYTVYKSLRRHSYTDARLVVQSFSCSNSSCDCVMCCMLWCIPLDEGVSSPGNRKRLLPLPGNMTSVNWNAVEQRHPQTRVQSPIPRGGFAPYCDRSAL